VVYPLFLVGRPLTAIESNTIQIAISQPEGDDATVWAKLKKREYLQFLQLRDGDYALAQALDQVRCSHPQSQYAPHLWAALAEYYVRHGKKLPADARQSLKTSLDVRDLSDFKDARLQGRVTIPIIDWKSQRLNCFEI
jgi:hypothetical protein